MNIYKTVVIMLVEDDPGDQKLVKMSLQSQRIANEIVVAGNGEEALEYLNECRDGDSKSIPDLILLDLNMPGMGGKEFLRRIKTNEDFKVIPVVILTTSDSDKDILESFKLQAAGYIKKPVELEEFQKIMQGLSDYWFTICKRVNHDECKREDNKCFVS